MWRSHLEYAELPNAAAGGGIGGFRQNTASPDDPHPKKHRSHHNPTNSPHRSTHIPPEHQQPERPRQGSWGGAWRGRAAAECGRPCRENAGDMNHRRRPRVNAGEHPAAKAGTKQNKPGQRRYGGPGAEFRRVYSRRPRAAALNRGPGGVRRGRAEARPRRRGAEGERSSSAGLCQQPAVGRRLAAGGLAWRGNLAAWLKRGRLAAWGWQAWGRRPGAGGLGLAAWLAG